MKTATTILALSFIPIEISKTPIPLTIVTFIAPVFILYYGIPKTKESLLILLVLFMSLLLAFVTSMQIQSFLPIFSYLSFFSPILGFFIAFYVLTKPLLISRLIRLIWIPGLITGIALAINLFNYSGVVRGSVAVSNTLNGDFLGSTALGSLYGLNIFAAYGINSLAGICLALVFLLSLSFFFQTSRLFKFIIITSIISIGWYGAALESRGFWLGTISFIGFILLDIKNSKLMKYVFILILAGLTIWLFTYNPRFIRMIQLFNEGDLQSLTSNRSVLWEDFLNNSSVLFGTSFRPIQFTEYGSTSYHLYIFSLIGKTGIIIALPLLYIFWVSINKKSRPLFDVWPDRIITSASYSFLVQSFVWDIYAVQLYGHIAWFFLGLRLASTHKSK